MCVRMCVWCVVCESRQLWHPYLRPILAQAVCIAVNRGGHEHAHEHTHTQCARVVRCTSHVSAVYKCRLHYDARTSDGIMSALCVVSIVVYASACTVHALWL